MSTECLEVVEHGAHLRLRPQQVTVLEAAPWGPIGTVIGTVHRPSSSRLKPLPAAFAGGGYGACEASGCGLSRASRESGSASRAPHARRSVGRIINPKTADEIAGKILKQKLRTKSDIAVLVRVEDDTTKSIVNIRKIHPPAHVIVISEEYSEFKDLEQMFHGLQYLKGYYSHKNK